jgi:hypothetical protein
MLIEIFLMFLIQGIDAQQQEQQSTNPYEIPSTTTITPQVQQPAPQQQQVIPPSQQYVPQPPPTIIQTVPTTAPSATVDLGTLMTVLTPILAGIAGMFFKNRKDMDKKDKEVEQKTTSTIDQIVQSIIPMLQQNVKVAKVTANQEVKINEVSNLLYKVMGEKANEIQGLPEIQQVNLLKDAIKSQIIAEQCQENLKNVKTTKPTATTTIATTENPNQQLPTVTNDSDSSSNNSTNPYAS